MRKKLFAGLAIALLLGGCAAQQGTTRSNERPEVEVAGDTIQRVAPNPLRFKFGNGAVVIVWHLKDKNYSFPADGITIDGVLDRSGGKITGPARDQFEDCRPLGQGQQYQCKFLNSRKGVYKYTVRVLRNGQALKPFDPEITNLD
jgi:hypothetical protein